MRLVGLGALAFAINIPCGMCACPALLPASRHACSHPPRCCRLSSLVAACPGPAPLASSTCRRWRAHLRKLSAPWFVSIHASIPGVIAARRALSVPRSAVVLSIVCAIAGQQASVCWEGGVAVSPSGSPWRWQAGWQPPMQRATDAAAKPPSRLAQLGVKLERRRLAGKKGGGGGGKQQ